MPGSIEKRGENSYRLIVSDGDGPGGRRKKYTKTIKLEGKTEAEKMKKAKIELAKFISEVESNNFIEPSKLTFEDFIKKWLKDYAEKNLAPKTLSRYKEMLDSRIIPALGHMKLDKLRPLHFVEFYNNLQENGMRLDKKYSPKKDFNNILSDMKLTAKDIILKSGIDEDTWKRIEIGKSIHISTVNKICKSINVPVSKLFIPVKQDQEKSLSERTILHHHRLMHAILETAVKWQQLPSNPLDCIDAPKVHKTKFSYYDEEEINMLFNKLDLLDKSKLKYKVAIILTLASGLRLGELMGLTWGHVDFENRRITISQANQYIKQLGTFTKDPKNETSVRTLTIPAPVMDLLKTYKNNQSKQRLSCGDKWVDTDFVFTKWNGEAMYPYTVSNWFANFLKDNNLKKITFHQLRHTSATLLINAGVNIREVSGRLGHSKTSTTLDIYSHILKSADDDASDKMEDILFHNYTIESKSAK